MRNSSGTMRRRGIARPFATAVALLSLGLCALGIARLTPTSDRLSVEERLAAFRAAMELYRRGPPYPVRVPTARGLVDLEALSPGDHVQGARLQGLDISGRDYRRVTFESCDMRDVELRQADLRRARFWRCKAGGADFSGADLRKATLVGCDLVSADLSRAQLQGALFVNGWPGGPLLGAFRATLHIEITERDLVYLRSHCRTRP